VFDWGAARGSRAVWLYFTLPRLPKLVGFGQTFVRRCQNCSPASAPDAMALALTTLNSLRPQIGHARNGTRWPRPCAFPRCPYCGPGNLETGITSRASVPNTKIVSSVTRTERDVTSLALLSASEAVIWCQP
jgi:hypothetical protein